MAKDFHDRGGRAALGRAGEEIAHRYLLERGCKILERNWRTGHAEVDFIVLDGEELVVVEVKTRRRPVELPGELLSAVKCRKLLEAGAAYMALKEIEREIRFDLLLVHGRDLQVEYYREALKVF
jgi:putative endonuclease